MSYGFTTAVLFLVIFPSLQVRGQQPAVTRAFETGRNLIEKNCGDCAGATQAGLQDGIREMLGAIESGYRDRVAALRLLAEAYHVLAFVYHAPESPSRRETIVLRTKTLEQLVMLAPKNAGIRYEYAMTVEDPQKQIAELRQVLAIDPPHEDTRFALAMSVAQQGGASEVWLNPVIVNGP